MGKKIKITSLGNSKLLVRLEDEVKNLSYHPIVIEESMQFNCTTVQLPEEIVIVPSTISWKGSRN